MIFWTGWLPLTPEAVRDLSDVPGLYEVKVDTKSLVQYPTGKSAMVFYGKTDDRKSLRKAVEEDWFAAGKQEIRAQWGAIGPLVFRWAATADPDPEHLRRLTLFVERFGRIPWGNAD